MSGCLARAKAPGSDFRSAQAEDPDPDQLGRHQDQGREIRGQSYRYYYNPNSTLISSFSFLLGKLETEGSYGLGRKIRLLLKKIRQRLAPCNLLATQKHLSLIGTAEL